MRTKFLPSVLPFLGLTLLMVMMTACAGTGGGSPARSSGTPVNPRTNPGGADTATATSTGAQPRRY